MSFFIRADANPNIGMGHVMRCLSIADALRDSKQDVIFILADKTVEPLIKTRGYEAFILNSDYKDMDSELPSWPKQKPYAIIVDSYFVTSSYLTSLKQRTEAKIIYIDDLASFPYPVDILIAYNAYADSQTYEKLYGLRKLPCLILGLSYAPLREMFQNVPHREQPEQVKNILISTGGADFLHLAKQFLQYPLPKDYVYHLLIGSLNTDKDEIEQLANGKSNVVLHENVSDMRSLIESCDVAISAAGSTLYEICACGVPLITYSVADNQLLGAEAFEKLGLAINCGDLRTESAPIEKIMAALTDLVIDHAKRTEMGAKMQSLIDGKGANRLSQAMPISMIDFLDHRQNPLWEIPKFSINTWISTLLTYLGDENWLSKNPNHPISKLWKRQDAMSTNELVTFARAVFIMEGINKTWLSKTMKIASGKDINNAHGAMFEILALSFFKDSDLEVLPASMSKEGIDGTLKLSNGLEINLSLKYYGITQAELAFQRFMKEINDIVVDSVKHVKENSVDFSLIFSKYVDSKSDKEKVKQLVEKVMKRYKKYPDIHESIDFVEIFARPIQMGYNLSNVIKSHKLFAMSPMTPNEYKNLNDKIDDACRNLKKFGEADKINGIIIHIHENANIKSYIRYLQHYLNKNADIPISFIILYQASIAFDRATQSTHNIFHTIQCAVSPRIRPEILLTLKELKTPIKLSPFVGDIGFEPTELTLFGGKDGKSGKLTELKDTYLYQNGEIYAEGKTMPNGSVKGDLKMIAPGLRVNLASRIPAGKGRTGYASFQMHIPEDDHLEIL